MTDLLIEAPGRLVVRTHTQPPPCGEGGVVVEVGCVSLCGSDFRLFDGSYGGPRRYPIRFGHEWAGRVIEASSSSRLRPGTRVTGDCSIWCGRCSMCETDRNLCASIEKYGITCDGFSTRYRAVPERYLYADELGIPEDVLALTEIFAVALRGIANAPAAAIERGCVLVLGAGPLGLATFIALTQRWPALDVRVVEACPEKLTRVKERFPQIPIEPADERWTANGATYRELSALARYAVVFECSGSAHGLDVALAQAAFGGHVLCFGLGAPSVVRMDLVATKGLTLRGSIGGTGAFREAMALVAQQSDVARRMVTHHFLAAGAQKAFEKTLGAGSRIKVQLFFGEMP